MKKYISYLLASALLAPVFVSCNERLQEEEIPVRTHKVLFSASQAETRTGLSVEGTVVTPDWNKTQVDNIHLFETDANDKTVYGETLIISMSSDKETAQFEADFPEDMVIAVGTGSTAATGGSVTRVAPYNYTAVIAQKAAGETIAFVIPAEQHPDAETLKDPNADFLVGYGAETVDAPHNYDEPVVDLYFTRAAAMGRVAISNFSDSGETVQSVTISTAAGLTGSAALSDIDFENGAVTFTRAAGDLVLVYDNGAAVPSDGTFYAYFVAIPGEATITSIEVVTDQFRYTKEIGKASTFSAKSFKNFTLDLSTATKEAVTPSAPAYVKVTSVDDLVVGGQYLLVFEGLAGDAENGDPKVFSPTLNSEGTQFQKKTDYALDVTITDSTIETGDYEDCQFTLEAGYYLLANKAGKYIVPTGTSNSSGTITAESPASTALSITFDNGIVQIKATSGTNYLVWSTSSQYFSSNASVSGQYSTGICLYMLDDGRQSQSFAFTQPTVEYNFDEGGDFPEPTFTVSPIGEVTYSSDNTAVASVNASTGEVTVLKAGTAVISARAAGNNKYRAHTASYTIHSNTSKIQKWVKAEEIEDGEKYLIVSNGEALQNNSGSAAAVAVVENSGVIMYNATDDMIWTAAATSSSGKFTFQNNGQYMQRGGSSGSYVPSFSSSASSYYQWSYNYADSYLTASGNSTYYVYYSENNSKWSMSTSSGNTHQTVIFKLDDGRTPQEIAFSAATAEYDLYKGEWTKAVPSLQNAQGTVTYESSDPTVATVDASGNVTPIKKGTTTITAKAAGNATYRPGEASYTVKVVDSNPAVPKYYKVEEIEAGQTYIIVSEGQAMTMNGTTLGVVSVTDVDGVIETDEDLALWTAAEHVEYYSGTSAAGHFTLKNGDNYLQRHSDSGTQTASVGGVPSTGKYYVWEYDGTHLYHLSSASNTFYLGYSSGWKFNYQSPYYTASLYSTTKQQTKLTQSISFSTSDAKYDKGTSTWTVPVPTLSGAQTDVTFSSSNEAVATVSKVDNTTVNVTIASGAKKNDTAVITATAEGTETYKSASASFTVTVDDSSVVTPEYVLVESDSDIEVGAKYLLVNESNSKVFKPILNNSSFTASSSNALSATIQNHTIVSEDFEACELTLEEGYYFFVESANRYLYPTSSSIGAEETKSSSHSFSISIASDGVATISRTSNNSTYKLRWTSSGYFQSSTSSANCQLYKLQENGPKKRNLAFSVNAVSVNIYGKSTPIALSELTTVPTLSGNGLNDVTYSIDPSTSNVAEVSATGVVTVKNTGTVTIKASAGATSEYQADNASYTLTVTSTSAPTYTKVNEITSGGTYLIVSHLDKLAFEGDANTPTGASKSVSPNNGVISASSNNEFEAYEVVIKEESSEHYSIYFSKLKRYLALDNNTNSGLSSSDSWTSGSTSTTDFTMSKVTSGDYSGSFLFAARSGSSRVLYHNDTQFKLGGSGTSKGVHLYKKN
jgi:hypothetical protein